MPMFTSGSTLLEGYQKLGQEYFKRARSVSQDLQITLEWILKEDPTTLASMTELLKDLIETCTIYGQIISILGHDKMVPGALEQYETHAKNLHQEGKRYTAEELLNLQIDPVSTDSDSNLVNSNKDLN